MLSTLSFALRHRRGLTFGALLMALSSFGQTYYVSLFGADFRAAFHLSDGTLGAAYAAGTVCSALTLTWAGRLIDLTTVKRYICCVAALLSIACLLAGGAVHVVTLGIAFYFLRLGDQGLMMHTAMTATARAMGTLIDWGVPLRAQALGCLLYIVGASRLATRIRKKSAAWAPSAARNIALEQKVNYSAKSSEAAISAPRHRQRRRRGLRNPDETQTGKRIDADSAGQTAELIAERMARPSRRRRDTDRIAQHRPDTDRATQRRRDTDRNAQHRPDTYRNAQRRPDTDRNAQHRPDTDRIAQHRPDTDRTAQP